MRPMSAPAKAPSFVGMLNPIARRVLKAGPLLGPNALITVRGRKSGIPRATPIARVEIDGGGWVIGTFGDTDWVRNVRAAGQAARTVGRSREGLVADERDVEGRTRSFREVLGPYVRAMRIGTLLLTILGASEILNAPRAAAEHRPVFELRPA